ncbi:MAG: hypothetical protein V1729_04115, partial [Candidatus Woesearchaeota archaeon]
YHPSKRHPDKVILKSNPGIKMYNASGLMPLFKRLGIKVTGGNKDTKFNTQTIRLSCYYSNIQKFSKKIFIFGEKKKRLDYYIKNGVK